MQREKTGAEVKRAVFTAALFGFMGGGSSLNGAIEEGAIILSPFSAYFCQDVPDGLFGPNQLRFGRSL